MAQGQHGYVNAGHTLIGRLRGSRESAVEMAVYKTCVYQCGEEYESFLGTWANRMLTTETACDNLSILGNMFNNPSIRNEL